jgi:hypothetical protein
MPVDLPSSQPRPRGLTRWLLIGVAIGFAVLLSASLVLGIYRTEPPELVSTGIAPTAQSGRPFR